MGLNVSPELFAASIQAVLSGLEGMYCIADDLLITVKGEDMVAATSDHNDNLIQLFERCRQQGIKFKFNRQTVTFMGHDLTPEDINPSQSKIDVIQQMPIPEDKAAVQRLLGMAMYPARYCPSCSEVTAPLRQLLRQNVEFRWDVRHTEALNRLKQLLTTAPVLGYFSPTEDVVLQCDSSSFACLAVMLQNGRVIEYALRSLTEAKKGYAQIEKELISVQFAFERFHTYVYGRHVQVQTDHKPLLSIHKKALGAAPKRLHRMLLRLQCYDFDLCFVNGHDLVLADTLSCAVARDSTNLTQDEELASLDEQTGSDL